uniref:Uncharacterized protein n=1 Tax=Panagrolaimus sp. ES5 TaxID=591445 RepID=A0AC34GI62_9BILA
MGLAKRTTTTITEEEEVEVNAEAAPDAAETTTSTKVNNNDVIDLLEDSMDIFQTDNDLINMQPQTSAAASLLRPQADGMRTPPQKRKAPVVGSKSVDSGLKRFYSLK